MRLLFVIGFIIFSKSVSAQVVLPSFLDITTIKPVFIELRAGKVQNSSFSSFRIEDSRLDQQTYGYIRFTGDYKKYNRLELKDGVIAGELFLNKSFSTNSNVDTFRLLIQLHNFFITQEYQSPQSPLSLSNVTYQSKLFLAADLFIETNQTKRFLGSVDTIVTLQKWLGKVYNHMAENALLHLLSTAEVFLKTQPQANAKEYSTVQRQMVLFPETVFKDGFYLSYIDFLQQNPLNINYRIEKRKKVWAALPFVEADTFHLKNSWGFVNAGVLYVRKGSHYIPLQKNLGSWSGLGISFSEVPKVPLAGALLGNPFMFAADLAEMAINGPTAKLTNYCLYQLNPETGELQ